MAKEETALTYPNVPATIWWTYVRQVGDFIKPGDPPLGAIQAPEHPQWIYTIGLEPLKAGKSLDTATPIGWRFLSEAHSSHALSAMVGQCNKTEVPKLTGLSRGPRVALALHAARQVKNLAVAKGRELAVLTIPGILTEAFWLKSKNSKDDWYVPFLTASKELHNFAPYSRADFQKAVQKLARERLDLPDAGLEPLKTRPPELPRPPAA